jgi:hypothetical protein
MTTGDRILMVRSCPRALTDRAPRFNRMKRLFVSKLAQGRVAHGPDEPRSQRYV